MSAAYVDFNPTMATASMTVASNSVNQSVMSSSTDPYVESREETIEKLKAASIRYARANDRRMLLRSLKEASFLSYIPLEEGGKPDGTSMRELQDEVFRETLVLNGTTLNPPAKSTTIKNSGTNSGSLVILKGLTRVFCEKASLDAKTCYERVVTRLAKSLIATDISTQLNAIFGSEELIVKQIPSESSEPNDLQIYKTGEQVQMTLETKMNFGLFRKSGDSNTRAWIQLECKVRDRSNLSTNESFRGLIVKTPEVGY